MALIGFFLGVFVGVFFFFYNNCLEHRIQYKTNASSMLGATGCKESLHVGLSSLQKMEK